MTVTQRDSWLEIDLSWFRGRPTAVLIDDCLATIRSAGHRQLGNHPIKPFLT